jgi:YidC/Oxa1 family membrane protein insertase
VLSQLLDMVSFPIGAIPIWDQYVTGLEHVLDFFARITHSPGIAVILFTIAIKTLLLPLTIKSIRSSKSMQELQPKVKELQKKYGKDRQRLSQETMALYQQYQVNPLAGCLPMLIQIPIFFGVYRAISHLSQGTSDINPSQYWENSFLWLDSLNVSDPYKILPILAGVFQFIQTRMSRPAGQGKPSDPQQAMMNTMMNFMPLMVVVFGWSFDSGPVIYWVTQSVYSVVQQWLIAGWGSMKDWFPRLPDLPEHRQLGYKAPRNLDDVVVVSGTKEPQSGVMGWMQRKADEAQAQRARMEEERKGKAGGSSSSSSSGGARSGSSGNVARTKSGRPKINSTKSDDDVIDVEPAGPVVKPPRPIKRASSKAKATATGSPPASNSESNVSGESPAPRKVRVGKRPPEPEPES